ncbi:MAG: 6-phosphofructokinase, partial [Lachnospiraceae bacterium]
PYKMTCTMADVDDICNAEKGVPTEWIIKEGSDISSAFIDYAKPLIQGHVEIPMKEGLPDFAYRR